MQTYCRVIPLLRSAEIEFCRRASVTDGIDLSKREPFPEDIRVSTEDGKLAKILTAEEGPKIGDLNFAEFHELIDLSSTQTQ